jgi:hypothetical protein
MYTQDDTSDSSEHNFNVCDNVEIDMGYLSDGSSSVATEQYSVEQQKTLIGKEILSLHCCKAYQNCLLKESTLVEATEIVYK